MNKLSKERHAFQTEQNHIVDLAEEALNVAIEHIQEQLGIDTGDVAGMFFCGSEGDSILKTLKRYIQQELDSKE
jgi:hypothetical protein